MSSTKEYKEWKYILKRFSRNKGGMLGLIFLIAIFSMVVLTPFAGDPYKPNIDAILEPPSLEHLLGTDDVGRDVFARLLNGAQISLLVGVVALVYGSLIGIPIGLISGWKGGLVDDILMRFVDVLWAFPTTFLALFILAVLGPSISNLIIVLGIIFIVPQARIVRGQVLQVKSREYILAAKAIGLSQFRILTRYVLPNIVAPIIVIATVRIGTTVTAESGLSFLGIGVPPPIPTWGRMLADAWKYARTSTFIVFPPLVAITVLVLGFNLVGDGLRDSLDPRLR